MSPPHDETDDRQTVLIVDDNAQNLELLEVYMAGLSARCPVRTWITGAWMAAEPPCA